MIALYLIAAVVVIFLIVVALQPAAFTVTRSARLAVPPEKVFPHVNDLHQWEAWSPWAKMDPNSKNSFQGPASGVGAALAWAGNHKVGEGRMTITESQPGNLIRFRLEFLKPMKATNLATFSFQPEAGQTIVTWTMSGNNNFVGKAFGLVVNCDRMIGGQFEQGLANLKGVAESGTAG